jgi:hypothetical protein
MAILVAQKHDIASEEWVDDFNITADQLLCFG